MPPSSRGLGHFPFTEVTGIRIPLGVLLMGRCVSCDETFISSRPSAYTLERASYVLTYLYLTKESRLKYFKCHISKYLT